MPERTKSAIIHAFEMIHVLREDFGVSYEGEQIIVRIAGGGSIKPDGLEMINAYLSYKFGRDVKLTEHKEKFDFEDYRETALDGPGMAADIQNLTSNIDYLIDQLMKDKSDKFKGTARKAIADVWKNEINDWLNSK